MIEVSQPARLERLLLICCLTLSGGWSQDVPPETPSPQTMHAAEIAFKQSHLRRIRSTPTRAAALGQSFYDVTYYALNLEVDLSDSTLRGTILVRGISLVENFQSVVLNFDASMTVDSVGRDADSLNHADNLFTAYLSAPRQAGESFAVTVSYHGRPVSSGFGSFGIDDHGGAPIIWTLSEPYGARNWWPCKDTPADKADSVDIIVTVPDDLMAVSNGSLMSDTDNGDGTRTFHWRERYAIATYLISLAITNYVVDTEWFRPTPGDSLQISYYIYPEDMAHARNMLVHTVDMMAYFHNIFGRYPFWGEKYGIAQFPWGGGMEHQTVSSQGGFGSILTVHELAHQWWGDKITHATWGDIWLNEGFASYSEALYFEHANGEDYFRGYMDSMDRNFIYPIFVDDTTDVRRIFNASVYDKGGWVLHMLRHIVGEEKFFEILLAYSTDPRFAYGNATTAGFQDICETVAGQDLDWFFQPWIYAVGRPAYRIEWQAVDTLSGPALSLQIEQTQVPAQALFPMPVDVAVTTSQGDTVVTVFNDRAVQTFTVSLPAAPLAITLDPDGWILKRIESILEIPAVFNLKQNFPNPFILETTIEIDLPKPAELNVVVYNLLGREVIRLWDRHADRGTRLLTWNGIEASGRPAPSGIYFARVVSPDYSRTIKMVLLR